MKTDPTYQNVLKCLRHDGYAQCKDWVVRDWLCCSRISENLLKSLAQSLANDLRCHVRVIHPSQNNRDFNVRFFCDSEYMCQKANPSAPNRLISTSTGRLSLSGMSFYPTTIKSP